jgi:hypothetical protein
LHSRPKRICTPASPQAPTTMGTATSRPQYARCARPCVNPFLTCLGRYLVNGSNRFVRRLRVISDVSLVRSNDFHFVCVQVCATLKLGRRLCWNIGLSYINQLRRARFTRHNTCGGY